MPEFKIEKKGYNRAEVDSYISNLQDKIKMLEELAGDLNLAKQELEATVDAYKKREMVIEDTIVNASVAAREIVASAEKKALESSKKYIRDTEEAALKLEEKKRDVENTLNRVEYILKSQLALIEKE